MNMILHNNPTAEIKQGNTLANPLFLNEQGSLKTYDYVVANPPFSDKSWGSGVGTDNDPHQRFDGYGVPPDKNGDYAYLLHIIRSLKSGGPGKGKGACILPHGVLFRGNAEANIREALIRKGLIKGIIGLPANLFYGTGIPACIILIDKENSQNRKGIFMVDAGKGFIKDGPKNRLREMDIHKIVDVFNKQTEIDGYSKIVSFADIEKNEFNLNIPSYIDSSEPEDLQDIEAHLLGDIPKTDVEALRNYWDVLPGLQPALFSQAKRSDLYLSLQVAKDDIKATTYQHPEFVHYMADMNQVFSKWQRHTTTELKALQTGHHPKEVIHNISEALLTSYTAKALINKYDVYQHLMSYWFEVMQDDCYLIAAGGWRADTYRVIEINKKGKDVDKGWTCDLIPKPLVIDRYFAEEQQAINEQESKQENLESQLTELEEEHSGEEGALSCVDNKADANTALSEYMDLAWSSNNPMTFSEYRADAKRLETELGQHRKIKEHHSIEALKNNKGNVTKKAITDRLKQQIDSEEKGVLKQYLDIEKAIKETKKTIAVLRKSAIVEIDRLISSNDKGEYLEEIVIIRQFLKLTQEIVDAKKKLKEKKAALDTTLLDFYPTLSEEQIKQLVVDDKWMASIDKEIHSEMDRISQRLTQRVKELAERYETPLPEQTENVLKLEKAVDGHLEKMGFVWN